MKAIKPHFTFEQDLDGTQMLRDIERYGRTCYKSESNITEESTTAFIRKIVANGHESVLEHEKITIRIVCDRGVSHEIVRHRIASYSQESTRYCNYANERFGRELVFIMPVFWSEDSMAYQTWKRAMIECEKAYLALIDMGATPQEARSVLPNSLKTEIVVTMNLREWRHFFRLRTSERAHPQMREICVPMLHAFQKTVPVVFDDIIV